LYRSCKLRKTAIVTKMHDFVKHNQKVLLDALISLMFYGVKRQVPSTHPLFQEENHGFSS